MELTDLEQQRLEKLERLQAEGIEAYPNRVDRTHTIAEAIAALKEAEGNDEEPPSVVVTGRLRSIRTMGKIAFADLEDGTGSIQLFLRVDELDDQVYETFKEDFDLGDFVEARGPLMRTRTGEISVLAQHLRMISKAISPLPVIKEKEVN